MAIDPVCGMRVNEEDAAGKVNYHGREYYFCSHECEDKFKEEPEKFVKAA